MKEEEEPTVEATARAFHPGTTWQLVEIIELHVLKLPSCTGLK